jgi:DNA invertase Pin-like site-specific DNA recombinase
MNKHIAIYVRVSSRSQDLRSQETDLKRWAEGQDKAVVYYKDKFTGTTMDRPGWLKLQAAIERGEVSAVVCWRLDRLGRTARGLTALFADLQERGINLVSLGEGIDLAKPAGRMLANVLASLAQFETEIRRERQQAGIEAAKIGGKTWGGRAKGVQMLAIAEKADAIRTLHAAGKSVSEIARAAGVSRPTVYAVVRGGW